MAVLFFIMALGGGAQVEETLLGQALGLIDFPVHIKNIVGCLKTACNPGNLDSFIECVRAVSADPALDMSGLEKLNIMGDCIYKCVSERFG